MTDNNIHPFPEDWETVLAVVAHPDDMEYGSASAVARWTSLGKKVVYVMVTKGEAGIDSIPPEECAPLRMQEQINSARVVGVDVVEFLGHKDGVIEYGLPLRRDITRAIRRHKPDIILTNNFELMRRGNTLIMADHRVVGLATLDAARDAGNRWIFNELLDEGHQPWNDVKMVALSGGSAPTHFVDVSDCMDKGVASLEEHKLYLDNLTPRPNPDDMLRNRAAETGKRFGVDYATTFQIINI